jgi:hypothetical protein
MMEYEEKKQIYEKSKYSWITVFMNKHGSWTSDDISKRADEMADIYYHRILGRE